MFCFQSNFVILKRSVRKNSNIIISFKQTLKDVDYHYYDIAGIDMPFDDFEKLCSEALKDDFECSKIDRRKG